VFEILGVIVAIGAIVTMSRRRGTDVVYWAGLALGGYLLFSLVGAAILVRKHLPDYLLYADLAGWAWIGLIFLFVRFAIGASKPKSWGMWSCPNCHYLNAANAIVWEACKKPYTPREKSSVARSLT